jgi:hypothetical protein
MYNENKDFVVQKNNNGALLNYNMGALKAYKEARKKALNSTSENNQINNLKEELNTLKSDIDDIKALLIKVLETK